MFTLHQIVFSVLFDNLSSVPLLFNIGDGPFPGVIDMYGDEGGLIEFRSSLLATRGFAALSLPYFDFEDLPKVMKEFKLEYFEEAARFLRRHSKVSVMRQLSGQGRIWQSCPSDGGDFFGVSVSAGQV